MTFGWQGFQVDHPDDWAPQSLSGDHAKGYARLVSPAQIALQIRWQSNRGSPSLTKILTSYEAQLSRDAKRAGQPFAIKTDASDSRYHYRWTGQGQGRGVIFFSESCSRVFILEVQGAKSQQLLPLFNSVRDSFLSPNQNCRFWSVLGLSVAIPEAFAVSKHTFQAGRTELDFSGRGVSIQCTRWGLGSQVLLRQTLDEWARASLGMDGASVSEEGPGIRLTQSNLISKREAIARLQPEHNQIITVTSTYRSESGRPQWDWIA